MTYLCVPIFVETVEQVGRDVRSAIAAGAEMIELRTDAPHENSIVSQELLAAMQASGVPWIVTCRSKAEGGRWQGEEIERLQTLRVLGWDAPYVDLELASEKIGVSPKTKLILSSHDFAGRPDRLHNRLLEMDQRGCDVKKIVWTARSVRDNIEAFEILQSAAKPTIALCMGEAGVISRILAGKFGAFLTFAALDDASNTAPGQITIAQMKGLYRWDKIGAKTKVYGVVAHPVGHSMSPAIHNAAFEAAGHDGVYVPLLVNPGYESFKAFMESVVPFAGMDLSGLSVTLPHKENALRYLQEKGAKVEALAARIGAVNTIAIDGKTLSGINTDYAAILDSITAALGCERKDLAGMNVAVLGAGGTGRTAVAALAHYRANVIIYNRTPNKAAALADEFGVAARPWEELSGSDCRVYVNTTSVGMHPNIAESPFGANPPKLQESSVVFDTIYNPIRTKLLQEAEAAGAKTISGVDMFVQQAAEQFSLWTGKRAPAEIMRGAIEGRLKG